MDLPRLMFRAHDRWVWDSGGKDRIFTVALCRDLLQKLAGNVFKCFISSAGIDGYQLRFGNMLLWCRIPPIFAFTTRDLLELHATVVQSPLAKIMLHSVIARTN